MVLRKILDQYVSSYQRWIKSVIRLGNNEALKTLTKTLTFVDANTNDWGSTIALPELCSGELIMALFMAAKTKSFRWKNVIVFLIFAQNRDCGYSLELPHWGSSNGYTQSMFYSRKKKNNVYPYKPIFFLYKSGVWGSQNYTDMFSWWQQKKQQQKNR